jgi:hypothetical protein
VSRPLNFCSLLCSFLHSLIKFSITRKFTKQRGKTALG